MLIEEGVYREHIIVNKSIEIIGDGDRDKVIIECADDDTILFEAERGKIANITIRYTGSADHSAVKITKGLLQLENCDIRSSALSCVSVQNSGTTPLVRGNRIHDGRQEGIYVGESAGGVIETNEICFNGLAGVAIKRNASPTVRNNKIFACLEGVYVGDGGRGVIENNIIYDNRRDGIKTEDGQPIVGRNDVYRNNADFH